MLNRNSGRDAALRYLEDNLGARVGRDPELRYSELVLPRDEAWRVEDDPAVASCKRIDTPGIKISLHPAQFERLLGMIGYIVDPELRESLGYRTPQEAAAFEVLQTDAREKRLRESVPTVREAYLQYITAIKLCT